MLAMADAMIERIGASSSVTRTKPGRPAMEPIEVTVDEDGKVTVIIDLKNGERGELELPFNLAKDLLMKLRSRLESFENRRGWR
jgi:hypothetical protein